MSFNVQNKYIYELKYENGEYYLPGNCSDHKKSFIIEEMESAADTVKYRTSLVVQDEKGVQKPVFCCYMTEMSAGQIRKYVSEYRNCDQTGENLFKTRIDFSGAGNYRSLTRKIRTRGKRTNIRIRKKSGTHRNCHFLGMFHYTYLKNGKIQEMLKELRPDNTSCYTNIPFWSMEINPKNGGISYWKIVLKDVEIEYRKGLNDLVKLYRLKFRAEPGIITRLYFQAKNICPEFCLWLTEDKEHIYQIEEFNAEGKKVIYQWLP